MRPYPRKRRPRPESLTQNLMRCVPRGSSHRPLRGRRLTRGAHLWCTSSTHRLRTPCRPEPALIKGFSGSTRRLRAPCASEPAFGGAVGGMHGASPRLADENLPLADRVRCGAAYMLREISETAAMPAAISSTVLKWEKLKRTHPLSAVPKALCMSGAQWAPGRVQMP